MKNNLFLKVLSLLLLLSFSFFTFADTLQDAIRQQEELNAQIQDAQRTIQQKEAEQRRLRNELSNINRTLESTNASLNQINESLELTEENIETLVKNIEIKISEVNERSSILQNRLTDIYIKGEVKFIDVLFQATSFSDFLSRYEMMKLVAQNDTRLLSELEKEKKALDEDKAELEQKKAELEDLKAQRIARTNELSVASSRHQTVIASITQERAFFQRMLDELEEQSRIIERQILSLQGIGGERPGSLNWPTPGYYRITSPYGWRMHPILRENRLHTGIDLGVPYGNNVLASSAGKVIMARYNGGYGHCIIIDHGGGMSTLYAHLSSYAVKEGDIVATGQRIGQIGTSGLSTGPHLHYEVRLNGAHTNPNTYLRR